MADWTYSAWRRQSTAAAQRDMLAQHLEEIENKIQADCSAHGYSRQSHPLVETLKHLEEKYDTLCAAAGGTGGGVSHATFTTPS